MSLKAGIVGAAGFAGAELVRILSRHPEFDLAVITSNSDKGQAITDLYPALVGYTDLSFVSHDDPSLYECDVVFTATPHTVAMKMVPSLLEKGIAVFDLSADYRLKDKDVYETWYGVEHTSANLLELTSFGLPEIKTEEINRARQNFVDKTKTLVACAGCYPTATSLAAFPAIELSKGLVVADAISGVTGAGRSATQRTHFCNANENFEAYGVGSHRHTPEIEQILGIQGRLVFTPHLAPASRGLLSTVTLQLTEEAKQLSLEEIHNRYVKAYQDSPFVEVLPLGQMPKTASVVGTNKAHIGIAQNKATEALIAVGAIDNLSKGAAGQAVQCANIVCGFDQTLGLGTVGMPV